MKYSEEQLIPVVAELAERYTSKESSSITYQAARQLMGAVIYCIQVYERNADQVYGLLNRNSVLEAGQAYEAGYQLLLAKVRAAQTMYSNMIMTFKPYGNRALKETFADGMKGFFERYDARFRPQDHLLTLDYPLLCSLDKYQGINRIERYIRCIVLEQHFLERIPEPYIYHVLECYHGDHDELLINVAGIVYRNLLGCLMAGRRPDLQPYSEAERMRLNSFIEQHDREELEAALGKWVADWNTQAGEYLGQDLSDFCFELKHAVQYDCIDTLLAV